MRFSMRLILAVCVSSVLLLGITSNAGATLVPFTEDFAADASDWRDAPGTTDLTYNAAGGPDGSSYASGTFNFVASLATDMPAIHRGHDEYGTSGSSGGAFVGDWITGGVTSFSAFVRHDAGVPLMFFTRWAGPVNFPGAAGVTGPVMPNTWTQISFAVNPGSPFVYEGPPSTYGSVFSNVGHIQIGVFQPGEVLAGQDFNYTFDLDQVSVTPEPGSIALLGAGVVCVIARRRRRA
jgi:hypothetical protein